MAVEKWRHCLQGGRFIIKMDHESLKFLSQQKLHSHLQKKGMAKLMGLDYVIQYRRGKENVVADALSCCQEGGMLAAITSVILDWVQEVIESYKHGTWAKELLEQLSVNGDCRPSYALSNGLIRYKGRLVIGENMTLRNQILQLLHNSPLGGHFGIKNTYKRVRKIFYWLQLKKSMIIV